MDAKEALLQQLRHLKTAMEGVRSALRTIEQAERQSSQKTLRSVHRFYNMRPKLAAQLVLEESGGSMPMELLVKTLLDGGIAIGKKRTHHNVRIGLEKSVALGHFKLNKDDVVSVTGKDTRPPSKRRAP